MIPIENIAADADVFTYDLASRSVAIKPVARTFCGFRDETLVLEFGDQTVCCTPLHRFFTGAWTAAEDLKPGMRILTRSGEWKELTAIHRPADSSQTVYNFSVRDTHTYFVGEAGLLVHNVKKDNPEDEAERVEKHPKRTPRKKKHHH